LGSIKQKKKEKKMREFHFSIPLVDARLDSELFQCVVLLLQGVESQLFCVRGTFKVSRVLSVPLTVLSFPERFTPPAHRLLLCWTSSALMRRVCSSYEVSRFGKAPAKRN
jgi:hypothetical protein